MSECSASLMERPPELAETLLPAGCSLLVITLKDPPGQPQPTDTLCSQTDMSSVARALSAPPLAAARQRTHAAATSAALAVPGPTVRRRWSGGAWSGGAPAAGAPAGRRGGARSRTVRVSASYSPYPWDERDYYKVALQMVQVSTRPPHLRLLNASCPLPLLCQPRCSPITPTAVAFVPQTAGPLGAGVQTGYFLLMRVAAQGSDMIEDSGAPQPCAARCSTCRVPSAVPAAWLQTSSLSEVQFTHSFQGGRHVMAPVGLTHQLAPPATRADRALVMSVGGDTLTGVAQLAQGLQTGAAGGRPLSLDLLWQVRLPGGWVVRGGLQQHC